MGMRINTNIAALGAQRGLQKSSGLLTSTLRQLSSARRINRAADDAAGLQIAEQLDALRRQSQVEMNNLQSGVNYAQTAEGGLDVQQQAVQRIRELAVQASNGTLSDGQRAAINQEAQQLIEQVQTVADDTQFNGQNLLGQTQSVDLGTTGTLAVSTTESTATSLNLDSLDLSTAAGATAALETTDTALNNISQNRASLGAQMNRFESAIEQRGIQEENTAAAESAIRDADMALQATNLSRARILNQGGMSALIQSNVQPQTALQLLGG